MAVSGPISRANLSEDALAALECGDLDTLFALKRAEFGGFAMMADDPDDDDDDDNDDDDTDDDAGDSGRKRKKSDDDDDDADSDDSDDRLEKALRRMKAADKRATEAERKLRERDDADKSDLEKAQGQVTELEKTVSTLQTKVSELTLHNAFLTSNNITWHDPDTALALAGSKGYLEDVVDEESGEVDRKALAKALEKMSKEHKYLVKSEDKNDDEPGGPSGEPAGGRSENNDDTKVKREKQKQRFPVLNR